MSCLRPRARVDPSHPPPSNAGRGAHMSGITRNTPTTLQPRFGAKQVWRFVAAVLIVLALAAAVILLVTHDDSSSSGSAAAPATPAAIASPTTRYDGGPEEGTASAAT